MNTAVELLVIDVCVIESFSDVVTGVVITLEFVVPVSYFAEMISCVAADVDIGVEVLVNKNVNVSAVMKTALELPMSTA